MKIASANALIDGYHLKWMNYKKQSNKPFFVGLVLADWKVHLHVAVNKTALS